MTSTYADFRFGCAYDTIHASIELIRATMALDVFSVAELPWQCLAPQKHGSTTGSAIPIPRTGYEIICGSIVDDSLSAAAPWQTPSFCKQYANLLSGAMGLLKKSGVTTFSLRCPVEAIVHDANAMRNLRMILVQMGRQSLHDGIVLQMPIVIPSSDLNSCRRFFAETMLKSVKPRLDVFVDDMTATMSPESIATHCNLDASSLVFHFNAEAGYHLTEKRILPWLDFMAKANYHGPVLFAPRCRDNRILLQHIVQFNNVISDIL